jgi:hypothetical protein
MLKFVAQAGALAVIGHASAQNISFISDPGVSFVIDHRIL